MPKLSYTLIAPFTLSKLCSSTTLAAIRVIHWSLLIFGTVTVPGLLALKCVTEASPINFQCSEKSYPSFKNPPYCSKPIFGLWLSLRAYCPPTELKNLPFLSLFIASACTVPQLPAPTFTIVSTLSPAPASSVTMFITPPIALLPYSSEAGPRSTSTLSAIIV